MPQAERTLVLAKPDAVQRGLAMEVMGRLERRGLKIVGMKLMRIDEALAKLAAEDAEAAKLVDLRFFAGLGHQETARILGLTRREADTLWAYARAWLFEAIGKEFGANAAAKSP